MKPLSIEKKINRIASAALVVGVLLLIIKFYAYFITDSKAILSDALESIVNVLGAFITLIAVYISSKPADKDHPYGHGKAEYFSVAFEGGFITFAAALIFYEAISAIILKTPLKSLTDGILITSFAGLINGALGFYLKQSGKKFKSLSLAGSGDHLISDFITSVGMVMGLVIVEYTKLFWIDSAIAILFGLILVKTGFGLVRKSLSGLMDAEDTEVIRQIGKRFSEKAFPGIIRIHHTRAIRSGKYHHIDAHVVVPEFWDVKTAHRETERFEKRVFDNYEFEGETHFHLDPCRRAYCEVCDLANCPIRVKPFKKRLDFTLEELTSPLEPKEFREKKIPPSDAKK